MEPSIVFFDGVCNLCNRAVDIVVTYGDPKTFKVAPLQGVTAQKMLQGYDLPDSIILLKEGQIYVESEAAIRIGFMLGGRWKTLAILARILPRFLTNFIYRLIAKNRYRWLGKRQQCRLPSPSDREFFLP